MSLLLAFLAAQAAQPQAHDPLAFDIRCFLATAELTRAPDPQAAHQAQVASNFFFGRIDARAGSFNLEERMWQESQAVQALNRDHLLAACSHFMMQRGAAIAEAARRMAARGQQRPR